MYLLLDENDIVRCMASEESNLHAAKISAGMRKVTCSNPEGTVGDKYDSGKGIWEAHPENYPQPTEVEVNEKLIQDEMNKLIREQAITNLKDSGKLPANFSG